MERHRVTLTCDRCGLRNHFGAGKLGFSGAEDLLARARKSGLWTRMLGRDYCASCHKQVQKGVSPDASVKRIVRAGGVQEATLYAADDGEYIRLDLMDSSQIWIGPLQEQVSSRPPSDTEMRMIETTFENENDATRSLSTIKRARKSRRA